MKVKAAVARSRGGALQLEGLTLAAPQPDEILVKMIACGVAQIDLDAIDERLGMPLPFVPGSEGAGIVERVGDAAEGFTPGDAVVIGFDYCGRCAACAAGRPRMCVAFAARNLAGRRVDETHLFEERDVNGRFFGQSSFATHVVCRASRAIKLAKGSPLEVLACLGGEVLVGAGVVLRALEATEDASLLVSGAGATGLSAIMLAQARGMRTIVVVEADERRRDIACTLGATVVFHPDENLADLVRSVAADGVRCVLETTGIGRARRACLESVAERGTCVFVGPIDDDMSVTSDRAPRVLRAEDYASPADLVPQLAALHARGELPLEQLIDFFAFEHVNDALEALRGGAVPKPLVRFSIGAFDDLDRARIEGAEIKDEADAPAEPTPSREPATVKS